MAIRITLTDTSGNPIEIDGLDIRLPLEDFAVLGTPNFTGTPTPDQTIVPSLRQLGGAVMTITADLPAPVTPVADPAETARLVAAWKAEAATRQVTEFVFEAMDFIATVRFTAGEGPTIQQLVKRWDFEDDILSERPFINGERYDPDDAVNGIDGTPGSDDLFGTDGRDSIDAGAGDRDLIDARGGDDTVTGGDGFDIVYGGDGNDVLDGGAERDELYGGEGDDTIFGGAGDDRINGDNGFDVIRGGAGNDRIDAYFDGGRLFGEAGDDLLATNGGETTMKGGTGNDTLYGGGDRDVLIGGAGRDNLLAGSRLDVHTPADLLRGGAGRDTLGGSWGDDTMIGGAGADTFVYYFADGTEDGYQTGDDVIRGFSAGQGDTLRFIGHVFDPAEVAERIPGGAEMDWGDGTLIVEFGADTTFAEFLASIEMLAS